MNNCGLNRPDVIADSDYRFDCFDNGKVLHNKKKNHLPAMGWNSWNAFGSGNSEALTKIMADKMVELGLDRLGYKYLVLDDGCYLPERVDGKLANETVKFPSGFRALSDYIHSKGLKFGMYNDIGTNLCAGAAVGTCGHEAEDAELYIKWGVDFLKVDNCYYLWDNATFSDAGNAKYVYAPAIAEAVITSKKENSTYKEVFTAGRNISVSGAGVKTEEIEGRVYFTEIGTFDGTGPMHSPVGALSGELFFDVTIPEDGIYELQLECICAQEPGKGSWLQVAVGSGESIRVLYDDMLEDKTIDLKLNAGTNRIRLMNHRRQENTLYSYAKLLEGLKEADPDNEIIYSMCEWGKTQPQNWAKKVGDSWRILNDITFSVGSDGNPGSCEWKGDYTNNVTAQYNKCVVMDEYAGLDKGWNDPDMMVIGMDHLNLTQNRTHMAMWCMMNSPLMLGIDLRRVTRGDELYNIIANERLIALNQDALGVQAKRVYSSAVSGNADRTYITNIDRVDILAKPLADGAVAVSFINVSESVKSEGYGITAQAIADAIGDKMPEGAAKKFADAAGYRVIDLWSGQTKKVNDRNFKVESLEACDNVTIKIIPE